MYIFWIATLRSQWRVYEIATARSTEIRNDDWWYEIASV